MTPYVIQEIMEGVVGLDVSEGAKQQFLNLVRKVGAKHEVKVVERVARRDLARRLLELKVSRPTIRDRLIATYGISMRQAYRTIDQALKLCQKI